MAFEYIDREELFNYGGSNVSEKHIISEIACQLEKISNRLENCEMMIQDIMLKVYGGKKKK